MKLHTGDYLKLAHTAVQAADRVEVFTLGTRLTRITRALKVRDLDAALERTAALVDDWDGGTRIGPTLLAFLAVPRFAAFARGAAIVLLVGRAGARRPCRDGDGDAPSRRARVPPVALYAACRRSPLPPETAALRAILPCLDDLVDGSSLTGLADFMLTLARPAPSAETVWRRTL